MTAALPVYQSVALLMFNSCQASRSTELIKAGKLQDAFAAVTRIWIDGAKPLSVSVPPPILWNQTHTAPAFNCYELDKVGVLRALTFGGILKCKGGGAVVASFPSDSQVFLVSQGVFNAYTSYTCLHFTCNYILVGSVYRKDYKRWHSVEVRKE